MQADNPFQPSQAPPNVEIDVAWERVSHPPDLSPGELHLWMIRADGNPDDTPTLLGLLGERQRRRAERMTRTDIQARYVQAQAGFRRILASYLNCAAAAVRFSLGAAGKPGLEPHGTDLEVNFTTTGDIALVALCRGHAVGIDCEHIRPHGDLDAIARRMFSPGEAKALAETPKPQRLERFHRAWTALEADCKCDGRGLFRPRAPGAQPPLVAHFRPLSGYIAAVASAELPPPDHWKTMETAAQSR